MWTWQTSQIFQRRSRDAARGIPPTSQTNKRQPVAYVISACLGCSTPLGPSILATHADSNLFPRQGDIHTSAVELSPELVQV